MGPCLAAPHLCWASGLLAFLSPLLSIRSTLAKGPEARGSGVLDSGLHFPVKGIRGGSVSFHVVQPPGRSPGEKLEEIWWSFGPESAHREFLQVHRGAALPRTSKPFEDKFKLRLHVPNMMSLVIENVTSQDSGQYRAQLRFTGGFSSTQVFHLTVYEPVPAPQILAESPSITSGWCNITLHCRATGATEQLNVSWESTGPPSELKQGGAPGPAPNSWTLAVSLPLSQPKASLTCVVSNQGDQKSATLDLGDVCVQDADSRGQPTAGVVGGILGALLLLILGAGLYLWRTRGKKKRKKRKKQEEEEEKQEEEEETDRGAALQRDHRGDAGGMYYAHLMKEETQDGQEKAGGRQHLGEQESIMTIYSQIHSPGQGMKII